MRDLAGTVYAQYFQEYLKCGNTNEAKLFAYECLNGAFLTENKTLKDIYHQKNVEIEITPELSVLLAARKFSV